VYHLFATTRCRKDLKKLRSRPQDFELIATALKQLQTKGIKGISAAMKPHTLKGKFVDNWECHIVPDLLIIWIQIEKPKEIRLVRVGSHSDLFR
jgi:mRNA interferase YafQ